MGQRGTRAAPSFPCFFPRALLLVVVLLSAVDDATVAQSSACDIVVDLDICIEKIRARLCLFFRLQKKGCASLFLPAAVPNATANCRKEKVSIKADENDKKSEKKNEKQIKNERETKEGGKKNWGYTAIVEESARDWRLRFRGRGSRGGCVRRRRPTKASRSNRCTVQTARPS